MRGDINNPKHPLQEYLEELKNKPLVEKIRDNFYANSPFDLCSEHDDKYRDAVDISLEEIFGKGEVGEHNPDIKKG